MPSVSGVAAYIASDVRSFSPENWALNPDQPTLVDLFREAASRFPDVEALVDPSMRLTYGQWWRAARCLAGALAAAGVRAGDVVAIALPSSARYAVCYAAIACVGAISTGLNPRLGARELEHILGLTRPAAVITTPDVLAKTSAWGPAAIIMDEDIDGLSAGEPAEPVAVDPAQTAVIVWTSGTTGFPKGAAFSNTALRGSALGADDIVRPFDRRFAPLSFVHAAFMTKVWEVVASGTALVIPPTPWRATETLDLLESERITFAQGVPTQWDKVTSLPEVEHRDLSHLRLVITSTAPASPELITQMIRRLDAEIHVRFASTESGPATGTSPSDPVEVLSATLGRPLPGAEIRIVDDEGGVLGRDEVGGIEVRHPGGMQGYWLNPDESAKTRLPDGWIRTGDLGHIRADGNLVIDGRLTDMYIRGGYNVYPREVELELHTHPDVAAVAVVGVAANVIGEVGVAIIVPEEGTEHRLDLQAIRSYLAGRIADYKLPDDLILLAELPLTAYLKVDKRKLKELAEAHLRSQRVRDVPGAINKGENG